MRNVAGVATAVVGREPLSFGRGIGRRYRIWSMDERVVQVDADS
jgi:hypothetical protein